MQIIKTLPELFEYRNKIKDKLAFVPTMGALHDGHLSLCDTAAKYSDNIIVSIFVNPKQFSANEDLDKYPHNINTDIKKLEGKATAIFLPSIDDIYPNGFGTSISTPQLTNKLCGISRPSHFDGVCTVVARLFGLVKPTHAVFGKKDYQQLLVIKRIVKDLNLSVQIIGSPLIREDDGLAMSSRNLYLSVEQRKIAPYLYKALQQARQEIIAGSNIPDVLEAKKKQLIEKGFDKVDYLELMDSNLNTINNYQNQEARLFIAAFIGKTRLIDNLELVEKPNL